MEAKKVAVVTGANAGLGFETAKALAQQGYQVALLCRAAAKGQAAVEQIKAVAPAAALEVFPVDLASQTSIRDVAAVLRTRYPVIDVLVNNAGTWISQHTLTAEGVETMFAVNHLAYFLLTHLLYPALIAAPDARVVCVASDSHFKGKIHFDNINLTGRYHGLRAYDQSKLANVLFVYELHRRKTAPQLSTYAIQPGLVKTDIGIKHTNPLHALAWRIRRSGGVSAAEGARCQVYCASAAAAQGQSGLYWDQCRPKPSSRASYSPEDASRLWDWCLAACGINDFFGAPG